MKPFAQRALSTSVALAFAACGAQAGNAPPKPDASSGSSDAGRAIGDSGARSDGRRGHPGAMEGGNVVDGAPGTGSGTGGPSESASCTIVTQPGASIVDASGNVWTLQGPSANQVVYENGSAPAFSAMVTELAYVDHVVSQQNAAGDWWQWAGNAWSPEANPTSSCGGDSGSSGSGSGSGIPPRDAGSGTFQVANGQILAPGGAPFVPIGIGLPDGEATLAVTNAAAEPLSSIFKGINLVRLACNTMSHPPSYYAALVSQLTSNHIVVVIENHSTLSGGRGTNPTGAALGAEVSWYSALATAFIDNPYVWFGTSNEPPNTTGASGTIVTGACTAEQVAIYDAIRGTGNSTIVEMEQIGGGNPPWMGANNQNGLYPDSAYATMHNIIWGPHFYNWITSYSTDVSVSAAKLVSMKGLCQQIQSADGVVPVAVFEYGVSTTGTTSDPGGIASATAVEQSGLGQVAWAWGPYAVLNSLCDDSGNLTSWGTMTAAFIAHP